MLLPSREDKTLPPSPEGRVIRVRIRTGEVIPSLGRDTWVFHRAGVVNIVRSAAGRNRVVALVGRSRRDSIVLMMMLSCMAVTGGVVC